jgi:cyclase
MKRISTVIATMSLLGFTLSAGRLRAQMPDTAKVTLKTTPVTNSISMIEGANGFAGGNVGVSVGDDGVFVIDDELAPMSPKLKAALAALSKKPVRFLVNTHWHSDHSGGNPALAAAGAVIVAQENVRKRLSVDQFREFMGQKMTFPAQPPSALPVITFAEDITLHLNGDEVHVVHVPPAHTDGDAFVHFKKANVIHVGDLVTAGYPVVDADSGGQFEGLIGAADKLLAIADDATKVIPGHGPLMTKADVMAWRQMLVDVRDRIGKLVAAKKTLEEIKAAKPLADLDAKWAIGFAKADFVIDAVVKTLPPPALKADKAHAKRRAKKTDEEGAK